MNYHQDQILEGNEEILNAYMSRVDIKKEEAKKYLFTLNRNVSLRGSRYEMFLSLYNLGLTFTENEKPKVIELFSYLVESVKEHQENDYYQNFEKILSTYLNEKTNIEYICIKHLHSLPNRNIDKAKANLMRMYKILEKYVDVSNLGNRINIVKDKKGPNLTISARNLHSTQCLSWFTSHIDIDHEKKLLESELLQCKENNKKLKI